MSGDFYNGYTDPWFNPDTYPADYQGSREQSVGGTHPQDFRTRQEYEEELQARNRLIDEGRGRRPGVQATPVSRPPLWTPPDSPPKTSTTPRLERFTELDAPIPNITSAVEFVRIVPDDQLVRYRGMRELEQRGKAYKVGDGVNERVWSPRKPGSGAETPAALFFRGCVRNQVRERFIAWSKRNTPPNPHTYQFWQLPYEKYLNRRGDEIKHAETITAEALHAGNELQVIRGLKLVNNNRKILEAYRRIFDKPFEGTEDIGPHRRFAKLCVDLNIDSRIVAMDRLFQRYP